MFDKNNKIIANKADFFFDFCPAGVRGKPLKVTFALDGPHFRARFHFKSL